jgi:transcription antitermination protein NusB
MLYALEASSHDVEQTIREFWREMPGDAEDREYADRIVRGVAMRLADLDGRLAAASTNWRVERMARIDRNLMRLAAWEIVASSEVPRAVVIDEAVEIAKRYGTAESGAFVNGVLSRVADDAGRADPPRAR